jgi:hypothetical protein
MNSGRNGGLLRRGGSPGRPKGSVSVSTVLRRLLSENGPDGIENAERVASALIERAASGNVAAIRELMARIDGPIATKLDVKDLSDERVLDLLEANGIPNPTTIHVVFEDEGAHEFNRE